MQLTKSCVECGKCVCNNITQRQIDRCSDNPKNILRSQISRAPTKPTPPPDPPKRCGLKMAMAGDIYDPHPRLAPPPPRPNTEAEAKRLMDGQAVKIYIAGKITGDPDYREKFAAAAERLAGAGRAILSPALLPDGMQPEDYMRICMAMVDTADVVCFLPDWTSSEGAKIEMSYANYLGKPVTVL